MQHYSGTQLILPSRKSFALLGGSTAFDPTAFGKAKRPLASNSKTRSLPEWTPQYGGLDDYRGLVETAAWSRQRHHLAAYKFGIYNL